MASPKKAPRLNNRKAGRSRNRQVIEFISPKTGLRTSHVVQHPPKSWVKKEDKAVEEVVES